MKTQKVLIVEDEVPITQALNQMLKSQNISIINTTNGEEGLYLAKTIHPDLIILDMILPKMDGESVLRQLREDNWGKTAKVLILSNLTHQEKQKAVRELGILDYVVKTDTSIAQLAEKIRVLLEQITTEQ